MASEPDLTAESLDRHMNEVLVTGALFAVLSSHNFTELEGIDLVLDDGVATNALWVWIGFMKSRYKLTITMDPEPKDDDDEF
jgi:hypothetical protein